MEAICDKQMIEYGSPEWDCLIQLIIDSFVPGDLISHEYIKYQFRLKELNYGDYATQSDFEVALQVRQFTYMGLIDKLRTDLLENEQYYLQSVRGEGYQLIPPAEQVNFAYEQAINDIKKVFANSEWIMKNVRRDLLDARTRQENADTLAKFSSYRQMVVSMLKKRKLLFLSF